MILLFLHVHVFFLIEELCRYMKSSKGSQKEEEDEDEEEEFYLKLLRVSAKNYASLRNTTMEKKLYYRQEEQEFMLTI